MSAQRFDGWSRERICSYVEELEAAHAAEVEHLTESERNQKLVGVYADHLERVVQNAEIVGADAFSMEINDIAMIVKLLQWAVKLSQPKAASLDLHGRHNASAIADREVIGPLKPMGYADHPGGIHHTGASNVRDRNPLPKGDGMQDWYRAWTQGGLVGTVIEQRFFKAGFEACENLKKTQPAPDVREPKLPTWRDLEPEGNCPSCGHAWAQHSSGCFSPRCKCSEIGPLSEPKPDACAVCGGGRQDFQHRYDGDKCHSFTLAP